MSQILSTLLVFLSVSGLSAEPRKPKETSAAKTVTVTKSLPLSKILAQFKEQTGVAIVNGLGTDTDPVLKLSLTDAPFWQALDTLAAAAGARVNLYSADGRLELAPPLKKNKAGKQPISYSGNFRVALRRLVALQDFETGTRGYTASFDVAWLPGFKPFYLEAYPRNLQMKDQANVAVRIPPAGSVWTPVDGRTALFVDVSLPALPRTAKKIGLLRGAFLLRGPSRMLTFSFPRLPKLASAKTTVKEAAGVSVTVSNVKLNRLRWSLRVTTKLPPGGPQFESYQPWDVNNEIYLLHKDGKRKLFSASYASESAGSSRKAVLTYHFVDTPKRKRGKAADWTLVYRAPASIIEVPVPFEFKNVELP